MTVDATDLWEAQRRSARGRDGVRRLAVWLGLPANASIHRIEAAMKMAQAQRERLRGEGLWVTVTTR